jgi:hypothetical protein
MEEGRPNARALRRAVCSRIDLQLRAQYQAVLRETVPTRLVALFNPLDIPEHKFERACVAESFLQSD